MRTLKYTSAFMPVQPAPVHFDHCAEVLISVTTYYITGGVPVPPPPAGGRQHRTQ